MMLKASSPPPGFGGQRVRTPDVQVVSGLDGELLLQNHMRACFVGEGYVPQMTDARTLWAWTVLGKQPAVRLSGRTLVLVVDGSAHFSHWLLDALPRLQALAAVERTPADYDQILVSSNASAFHAETCCMLGVPQDRLVARDGRVRFSCEAFDYVTAVRSGFVADGWVFEFLNQRFAAPAARRDRKLFISRSRARRRRLLNEEDLHPMLQARGYEIVYAEDLGVAAMASLCAQAAVIAGPHGAGLANAAFAPSGARVLEIYGAHLATECWRICSVRQVTYVGLQATDSSGQAFTPQRREAMSVAEINHADMWLASAALAQALDVVEAA